MRALEAFDRMAAAVAWFAGRVLERLELGDHVGYALEPLPDAGRPPATHAPDIVTFHRAWGVEPGHPA